MRSEMLSTDAKGFSIVLGGPIYQFLVRVGLVKPPLDRVAGRIIVITLFAWLPLLLLASLGGRLASGVKVPFLYDIEAHCRQLVALPMLIGAEVTIHKRMRMVILQFVERQIITPSTLPKFEGAIGSALRFRNSPIIELVLLALVFVVGNIWMKGVLAIQSDSGGGLRRVAAPAAEPHHVLAPGIGCPACEGAAMTDPQPILQAGVQPWHLHRVRRQFPQPQRVIAVFLAGAAELMMSFVPETFVFDGDFWIGPRHAWQGPGGLWLSLRRAQGRNYR